METPAPVSAVTLTQVILFCASGLLPEPRTVDRVTPDTLDRYRLSAVESDEDGAQ